MHPGMRQRHQSGAEPTTMGSFRARHHSAPRRRRARQAVSSCWNAADFATYNLEQLQGNHLACHTGVDPHVKRQSRADIHFPLTTPLHHAPRASVGGGVGLAVEPSVGYVRSDIPTTTQLGRAE